MTRHEMVVSVLQSLGFKPQIDDDGDIFVRYQMKVLAACNKITREIRLAKVYIDQTLKNVSASCEFYYNGEESLKTCLDKAIEILGMIRSTFIKTMRSFD